MKYLFIAAFLYTFHSESQITTDSLLFEGNYRVFHYIKPNQINSSLVFVLHGSGGNGLQMRQSTAQLEALAPSENITLVYPDAYKKYWNECRKMATSEANILDINDNAFFENMIEYFKKKEKINEKQVFVVGTSGGGHMAYKLAITMPKRIRAITAIIANLPDTNNFDCIEKRVKVPVMIVNGTLDTVNPCNGGEVIFGKNINYGFVQSTDRTFQYWALLAGYKQNPKKSLLPNVDLNDGKTIEKYTHKKRRKPEITLLKVIGGQHNYPNDLDVHLEAWRFFKLQLYQKLTIYGKKYTKISR
jgi:polyhydroxybutyrate depolymerase